MDRPCNECVWRGPDGCTKWDCEPLTRKELKEILKKIKEAENAQ